MAESAERANRLSTARGRECIVRKNKLTPARAGLVNFADGQMLPTCIPPFLSFSLLRARFSSLHCSPFVVVRVPGPPISVLLSRSIADVFEGSRILRIYVSCFTLAEHKYVNLAIRLIEALIGCDRPRIVHSLPIPDLQVHSAVID